MDKSIGNTVKETREKMSISVDLMSEYLKIDKEEYLQKERDLENFTVNMLEKISYLFGCDYMDIECGKNITPMFNILVGNIDIDLLNGIASVNKMMLNTISMRNMLKFHENNITKGK